MWPDCVVQWAISREWVVGLLFPILKQSKGRADIRRGFQLQVSGFINR